RNSDFCTDWGQESRDARLSKRPDPPCGLDCGTQEEAMPSRRDMLMLAGSLLALPGFAAAADLVPVKVGVLQFGTVNWEIETIRRHGFDAARGVRIETVKLASNDAA